MIHHIEVFTKDKYVDAHGCEILHDIAQLGIESVKSVHAIRVFLVEGDLNEGQITKIAQELLADPVTEGYNIGSTELAEDKTNLTQIEVYLQPGVTDPVATSAMMAIADMGITVDSLRTGRKYLFEGELTEGQKETIASRILANDCIEEVIYGGEEEPPSPHLNPYKLNLITTHICGLSDDELMELSKKMDMFLNLAEMKTIQEHYQKMGREPRDIELEMIAQTWSEHCVHKTFRGEIETTTIDANGKEVGKEIMNNLLKSTIAKATFELDKDWCISVFEDNAGVVEFDDEYAVCIKVETHNHPSAIEPYGGAATGIGGCIRDPMGTGLGAKPIANTDVFCFAAPDKKLEELPAGVLHPRRVMKGVVGGVRDYGNRMGIPTVNGAVLFDDRYMGNPLVFCGNIGIMPKDKCFGDAQEGNYIVVFGGKTGRDGIHGATFSSGEMTHEHEDLFSHAVQIGNAITEKKALDVMLQARDEELYVAITDCGAGGLSSAVGEMGEKLGAIVDLDKVQLKYDGLNYTEIWISEAQERMVVSVPPEKLDRLMELFESENVNATVIGTFGNNGQLELRYEGTTVGELDMKFLHDGLPKYTRKAVWQEKALTEPIIEEKEDYTDILTSILGDYNVASKEWVIRQYDHEVQGGSAIKPLVGIENDGPGDAAVVRPRIEKDQAIAISSGICPQFSDIDPYWMAMAAIDEAVRNVVSVGGRPDRICILDNFCWGNCDKADRLAGLVRAGKGCYDAAMAYETPFVSGKDSLNNEFQTDNGQTINIPGTLLVTAMTLVDDVNKCVTMDLKNDGNVIILVGQTKDELGGSFYYKLNGQLGANVPKVDLKAGPANAKAVADAIAKGLVRSCHDLSEGGLAVALAEMAFAGGLGVEADIDAVVTDMDRADKIIFSESCSRYLLEVKPENVSGIMEALSGIKVAEIGKVNNSGKVVFNYKGKKVIDANNVSLKDAWQKPLAW
ncbi:MAG: phosphoribosylformylglycinamidine synthase subunit PurL [Phycisphaerae bacterium]|nr:phosphoribosylformylglycinamidine synthase subunit PurL [Phycisphaerae bacterium]